MSDGTQAIGKIPEQALTVTAITPDKTLVDDTVVLVDGTTLTGSTVSPRSDSRVIARPNPPKGFIKKRR